MAAILHVLEGPDAGRLFTLTGDQITIGRNAENTIVLNDTAVSGVHTKIVKDEQGSFTLHDVSSTNGTFLNGREQRAADLRNGDRIRIGSTTMGFELKLVRRIQGSGDSGKVTIDSDEGRQVLVELPEVDLSTISTEELEQSYMRGKLLERLDRVLDQLDGPSEILTAALDASLAGTSAARGVILLVDEKSGEMVPSVVRDTSVGEDEEGEVSFSKSLAFEVTATGRVYCGAEPRSEDTVLCVPIRSTNKRGGVIYLAPPGEGRAYGPQDVSVLEAISRRAGVALSAIRWRVDFELLFSSTIDAIMNTIQAKDVYTRGHSERVRHYSKLLAKELGLSGEDLYRVTLGAALHDIGKVGMPDSVLKHNKSPILSDDQMAEVRKHPARGARILADITFLKDVIPAAELHHEDWDGGGYPHGLKGEEIPLIARIVAVADTYDAITTDRPYQKGKTYEEGHAILRKIAGKRLEPDLVEMFIKAWHRYRKGPVRRRPKSKTLKTTRVEHNVDEIKAKLSEDLAATVQQEKQEPPPDMDDRLSQIIQIG